MYLAGDIGGTKTLLQAIEAGHDEVKLIHHQRYDSKAFADFQNLIEDFLQQLPAHSRIDAACIGVAGPVEQHDGFETAQVTNLPWHINSQTLSQRFGWRTVRLINDFQAIAYAIDTLLKDDLLCLHAGTVVPRAPRAVLGAGTGLGQAIMFWCQQEESGFYEVIPSEGGHGDFAPGDTQQRDLVRYLASRNARVTTETVLSGRGLVNAYQFLAHQDKAKIGPEVNKAMQEGDAAAAISEAAQRGDDALAIRALELFVRIYGTQAGNLALTCMALGGVYIAGGIAPRIESAMQQPGFLEAFLNKPPMDAVMKNIPVYLVRDSQLGLKGAMQAALRLAR